MHALRRPFPRLGGVVRFQRWRLLLRRTSRAARGSLTAALMRSPNLRESFWRTLLTFNVTRVLIAILLLVYLVINVKKGLSDVDQLANWRTCVIYLVLAVLFAAFAAYYRGRFVMQLLVQIAVDVTVIALLYAAGGGARSGLAILFLFPLAGGAVLLPLV